MLGEIGSVLGMLLAVIVILVMAWWVTSLIARQGVKLKFDDFQQTTQEHVWPRLNKADLIATARKTWDERRGGRGVRLVGLHVTLLDPQMERQLVLGL